MAEDFRIGKGTQIRFAVLDVADRDRPADADLDILKGVTTSDIQGGATDVTTVDYDSGAWEDGKMTRASWSMPISGNVKASTEGEAAIRALWEAWAAQKEVWVERLRPGDTHWRGGVCSIMGITEPVPADGIITYSLTLKGRGAVVSTAIAVTP